MAVPNPRTWVANVTAFAAATMNTDLRDALNFLLGRGAVSKDYAKLTLSTVPASLANATVTPIPFDTEDWDNRGGHSTVSNQTRYVCQEAGKYRVSGQASFAVNATGVRAVVIRINGSGTPRGGAQIQATAVNQTVVPFGDDFVMNAGDYFEICAYQNSGGTLALDIVACGGTHAVVEWKSV